MNIINQATKNFVKGLFNPDNKLSLIPNWLSFSRVIGGISIPIMAYTGAPLPLLFGNISLLAISDFLDGAAARIIAKEETKEGAMLDAISDKIFSILLIIGILPILPIFAINGILEGIISIINGKLLASGGHPKSNLLGKIKIWPLSVALILGYLALAIQNLNIIGITNETLLTISTILSVNTIPLQSINIKQYFNEYKKQLKEIENNSSENKQKSTKESQINHQKQNKSEKSAKFSLSQNSYQAMVYEIKTPKSKETSKTYTKKIKH